MSFVRDRSVFSPGAEVSWQGAEVFLPKGAEVEGAEVSNPQSKHNPQNGGKIILYVAKDKINFSKWDKYESLWYATISLAPKSKYMLFQKA